MENLWCFSYVIAEVGYYKEGAGVFSTRVWVGQRQEIWDGNYLRQYSLYQGSR